MNPSTDSASRNGFDKLAAPYRWMEYLSFGPLLWRTRCAFLPRMLQARNVLVLGDGDGRFTAALLRSNPLARVHAVDLSGGMLQRLTRRVQQEGNGGRLETRLADATTTLPDGPFDLVCTHFFLDCLTDAQCRSLAAQVAARMSSEALWAVSDFAVPAGVRGVPARILVRSLYVSFRLLTGLRVQRLPDYAVALHNAGLRCATGTTRLGGILRSELWQLQSGSGPSAPLEHPIMHE